MHQPAKLGFRMPAEALRPLVSAYYWLLAEDGPVDEVLHPEWTNVRLELVGRWGWQQIGKPPQAPRGFLVFGPSNCAARITGPKNGLVLGFGLLPLGLARLLGAPAARLANRYEPLDNFWGDAATQLGDALGETRDPDEWARILDAALLARLAEAPPGHPLTAVAHRVLAEGAIDTVGHFAEQLGVSQRTLERLCGPVFGFGPKALLRRQRFLRTLDTVQKAPPGADLSDHLGVQYFDQSHFVREFKAFMGMTPRDYLKLPRIIMQRAAIERERLIGDTMQVLQVPR